MIEEEIANEIEDLEKQQIRVKQAQPSWVSMVQSKIISQIQLSQTDGEEKHDTNLGITPGRSERDPLFQSKHGSSVFFREDFGKSGASDFDPSLSKYRTQPHEVHFRVRVFIKYLALRVLFTIIGPLILVYGIFNEEWLHFMSNFRNYGLSKLVFWNYFRWASNYIFLFAFIFYIKDNGISKVYYEVMFTILVYLTENVTYAIKYAFFHPSKLVLIEKYSLCFVGDSCEQSINPMMWAKQCPTMIDKEIEQSMKRLQIEPTSFHMYFMVAPNPERFERIKIPKAFIHANDIDRKLIEHQGADCLSMVKEIINYFNDHCLFKFSIKFSLLISILKVGSYIVLVIYCQESQSNILTMVLSGLLQFVYFFFVIILMMLTYRDLRRKVFAMTQLSHLISAEKVEVYQEQKMFPTLNLLCIVSLYSWFNLRRVVLDYGLQYTRRSSFMLSFIMSIHTIMMAAMILLFYCKLITITSFIQSTIDFIIIASIFIALVLQGARINAHWDVHRGLLRKNLFLIQQLSYQIFKTLDYSFKPQDPVFAAFQKILELGTTQTVINDDQFMNYSLFCLHSIQNVFDDLGHQKHSQPYTVIGIAMTYEMLLQVCVSVLGLIGTAALNFILQITQ